MPADSRCKQRGPGVVLYWVPHEEEAWLPGYVKSEDGDKATLVVEGSEENEELDFKKSQLDLFHKVLPEHEAGVDDVCSLPAVPEGALLHTVRVRFRSDEIYTRVARTVIAVNPFRSLPIYSSQCIDQYMAAVDSIDLPPHIFGLSKDALQGIRSRSCDQAVLISGESGAGKTESAKLILSFVADAVRDSQTKGQGITEKVLQTNPVLEAFGNAMTMRNNNSSRFGKWLDLAFSGVGATEMTGCRLTSYLLETTRVCGQASDERGFHVFFQLLQARNSPHCAGLDLQDQSHYRYIKGCQRTAPGIDDGQCFQELCEALSAVGFSPEAKMEIFRIVAGVLLLGNCEFDKSSPQEAVLVDEGPAAGVAKHFGVDVDTLKDCFLVRKLHVGNDVTRAPLRLEQAQGARDALARLLYGRLFLYLIAEMNATLNADKSGSGGAERLLGVLDIAGFESFETNSLEQLMINLSNEQLQQHFNSVVIKDELKECEKENVPVPDGLNFADNADSVALIDGKGGILDLLDETMGMPGASNQSFVTYVLKQYKEHHRIIASKIARLGFGVAHYAGDVMYSCEGWLEKNANNPPDAAMEMLAASSVSSLQRMHQALKQEMEEASSKGPPTRAGAKTKTKSATMLFRVSLRSLATKIADAESHFMRCVKPNKEKVPWKIQGKMVMEQLLLSGVLATVHIRQKGYAHRVPLLTFYTEYRCVSSRPIKYFKEGQEEELRKEVRALLVEFGGGLFPTESFAMGNTKVFGKSEAVRALDTARREAEGRKALVLQRYARGRAARKRARARNEARAAIREFLQSKRLSEDAALPAQAREERGSGRARLMRSRTSRLSMWFGGSTLEQMGSLQALKGSIAELDALLQKAASVGLDNVDILTAERARLRMHREAEVQTALDSLDMKTCIDPVTLDKVLARARGLSLPRWETMLLLEDRLAKLHTQLPIIKALEAALAQDTALRSNKGGQQAGIDIAEPLSHLYEVANSVAEAGLDAKEQWLPDSKGAELAAEVSRRINEAEEAAKRAAAEAAAAEAAAAAKAAAAEEAARAVQAAAAEEAAAAQMAADEAAAAAAKALAEEAAATEAAKAAEAVVSTAAAQARRRSMMKQEAEEREEKEEKDAPEEAEASEASEGPDDDRRKQKTVKPASTPEVGRLQVAMQKATDEYDAESLELCLRQAAQLGVEDQLESLAVARQAFENLQVVNYVAASLEMVEREARLPDVQLTTLRRLENLSRQLRGMAGDEGEIAEATEVLQAALVQRYKNAGRTSILLSTDPEEVKLGNSTFSALSKFSGLKPQKAWPGHRPSFGGHSARTSTPQVAPVGSAMLQHSKVCIAGALTRAPHGMEEEEYEAGAIQNFRNILVAMGDRPAQACQRQASRDAVLAVARLEPALRSEVYMQALKQVSGNPNPRSARLGWELLHSLCLDAPPPVEVVEFVRAAFRDAAADQESEAAGMASACRALLDRPEVKIRVLGANCQDQLSRESAHRLSNIDMERARQAAEIRQLKEEMARLRGGSSRRGSIWCCGGAR